MSSLTGWDSFDTAESSSGSSMFLKFTEGEEVEGVFRGEPEVFYQIYDDPDKVQYKEKVPGSSLKVKVNLVVPNKGGGHSAKIVSEGARFRDAVKPFRKKFGDTFDKRVFSITKNGKGTSVSWAIYPIGQDPLTDDALKKIEAVQLNSLKSKSSESLAY